jgi:hypothetical protein
MSGNQAQPTPQRGDVLFIDDLDISAACSGFVQRQLDPLARGTDLTFEHVAIAIDDSFALEAMPAPKQVVESKPNEVAEQTIGAWTEVRLESGVRIVPLPDILVPSWRHCTQLLVLRSPTPLPEVGIFDLGSKEFLALIGSAYSVEPLKIAAEKAFSKIITNWIASKKSLSSPANNLAAKLGLKKEFLAKLAQELPNYEPLRELEPFFCSQLVLHVLTEAGAINTETPANAITPTGLYNLLSQLGWTEVTASDYSGKAISALATQSPTSYQAHYLTTRATIGVGRQLLGDTEHVKLMNALIKKSQNTLDDILKRVPKN